MCQYIPGGYPYPDPGYPGPDPGGNPPPDPGPPYDDDEPVPDANKGSMSVDHNSFGMIDARAVAGLKKMT